MTAPMPFKLVRNSFGRLVLTTDQGEHYEGVTAVRAFPIQAPDEGVSLVTQDGHEVAWVDRLNDVDQLTRQLIEEELNGSQFMPEIKAITHVSTFATPSTWHVHTDRGNTEFVLRGEEDIRRLGHNMLLIADVHGIHYLIRDCAGLDKGSKKILDRFL